MDTAKKHLETHEDIGSCTSTGHNFAQFSFSLVDVKLSWTKMTGTVASEKERSKKRGRIDAKSGTTTTATMNEQYEKNISIAGKHGFIF